MSEPRKHIVILITKSDIGGAQIYLQHEACIPDFEYCDIEGGQEAFGGVPHSGKYIDCIDEDPLFSGPPEYCITWENWPDPDTTKSPCIDTGCPTMKDPDSTRCDIGYCYFPQPVGFSENWQQDEPITLWLYPNPTAGKLDIRYSISDIRNIQIGLYDLSGKLILAVSNEVRHPGEHSNTVYVSDLPNGIYFVRLTSGNEQVVKKLLIKR